MPSSRQQRMSASSAASTAAAFATWDSDDVETSGPQCRVCLMSEEDEKTLCTPCKCTGEGSARANPSPLLLPGR